jgi:hypothetical protein
MNMARVLVIGYAPDAVDFSDPALPPGMTAEKVAAGLRQDGENMRARGWEAEHLMIRADDRLRQTILDRLAAARYDCIVIGGGVRLTTRRVPELEIVVAAIRQGAPDTPIAFNASPSSSGDAAARWLPDP